MRTCPVGAQAGARPSGNLLVEVTGKKLSMHGPTDPRFGEPALDFRRGRLDTGVEREICVIDRLHSPGRDGAMLHTFPDRAEGTCAATLSDGADTTYRADRNSRLLIQVMHPAKTVGQVEDRSRASCRIAARCTDVSGGSIKDIRVVRIERKLVTTHE